MRILVISPGALGDFILALGMMAKIRRDHADAHITLLVPPAFRDAADRSRYADAVVMEKPAPGIIAWLRLALFKRRGGFSHVYDLRRGAEGPPPDVSWMESDVSLFAPPKPYVLLVPGGNTQRWPAVRYGALAAKLNLNGFNVALLGTSDDADAINIITKACSAAVDLSGRTSLYDIATLARGASGAVGNDTGPLYLVAAAGCPVVALSSFADTKIPGDVVIVQTDDLQNLQLGPVFKALKTR